MKIIQIILTVIVAIAIKIVVGNIVRDKPQYIAKHSSTTTEQNIIPQNEQGQSKPNLDFELVTQSTGKYGEFKTFLEKNNINKDGSFYFATIIHKYTSCSDEQPYCSKIDILVFECEKDRYLVGIENFVKNDEIIKTTESKSKNWKNFNKSKLYKSIAKHVCPPKTNDSSGDKFYLTDERYKQMKSKPIYNYTPSHNRTRCADGTYSSSTGRGTCSHHGGIAY